MQKIPENVLKNHRLTPSDNKEVTKQSVEAGQSQKKVVIQKTPSIQTPTMEKTAVQKPSASQKPQPVQQKSTTKPNVSTESGKRPPKTKPNIDKSQNTHKKNLLASATAILILLCLIVIPVALFMNKDTSNNATDSATEGIADNEELTPKTFEDVISDEEKVPENHKEDAEYKINNTMATGQLESITLRKDGTRIYVNEEKCYAISPVYDFIIATQEFGYREENGIAYVSGYYSSTPKKDDLMVYWNDKGEIKYGFVLALNDADVTIDPNVTQEFIDAVSIDITGEKWAWDEEADTNENAVTTLNDAVENSEKGNSVDQDTAEQDNAGQE